jgi:hypothetical protein
MSSEHREYEVRPVGAGRTAVRAVKLPGEQRHADISESAKTIAKRLAAHPIPTRRPSGPRQPCAGAASSSR